MRRYVELPKARAGQTAALFSFPRDVLERIIGEVRPPEREGTWLEVGGGLGTFAHLAQSKLPSWKVYLNEMNRDAMSFATATYGLATIAGGPAEVAASGIKFDVISMIASLEHVPRPYELLSAYSALLRPGGRLVLGIPRFSPFNRAISHASSASVTPPYHVSHFDEHNIALLLRRIETLDATSFTAWQDGPNAFKLIDFVKTWPYWRIEVPTKERDAPRFGMIEPYPHEMAVWINALHVADEATRELIRQLDGSLFLTMIARRKPY